MNTDNSTDGDDISFNKKNSLTILLENYHTSAIMHRPQRRNYGGPASCPSIQLKEFKIIKNFFSLILYFWVKNIMNKEFKTIIETK